MFIGIAGYVSVGKSTFAEQLKNSLTKNNKTVQIVSLDDFLFSNNELVKKNLFEKKGFPESYNIKLIKETVEKIEKMYINKQSKKKVSAKNQIATPKYSHIIHNIVSSKKNFISPADIYIFEGTIAFQTFTHNKSKYELYPKFDYSFFLDADDKDIETWYLKKVIEYKKRGEGKFYKKFKHWSNNKFSELAMQVWHNTNAINNSKYISASKKNATFILKKDSSHKIIEIQ